MRVICSGPRQGQEQDTRGKGCRGGRKGGAQTENDKTCEGQGRRKKGRWILQPSVKTQKIILQCSSSSSFPCGEFSFFLRKRLMVRVLLLRLILLCCRRSFSFALEWATDAGEEQSECSPTRRNVQNQGRTVLRQSLLSGLLLLFCRASKRGARDYSSLSFFFPEKSHQFINLSAKEM